ncbi:hypothetical protein TPHA_0B04760 [Tetrapisispora phaffii CBS 4417]|uniref:Nitroreductase domain-containing protein n=1 Tax=Tetrapisispora phaffii (strain ATCC 24235 / CBS 4417 / NBRC 1672 / NRRL Y-8282 / UCD 70-5) TaxID=1071381 RepID=G8BQ64_TETPH|nr:hypothetical protein TPHA_0B04760 [Tetrapisispora phaffii CBS 4417]CCE62145.1 hypothetical protein TPHA_0B04760 [Tetrapisispora phaffii CBS 4417]
MSVEHIIKAVSSRRTIYNLKQTLPAGVTVEKIQEIVQSIVKDVPTAFNSQSTRAIILTGAAHKKAWESVVAAMPNDDAKKRPASARDEAFGSIIFMTDSKTIQGLQEKFPAYSAMFPHFADQANGAAQISTWTALHQLNLGCNLQHYNTMIREALPADVPKEWEVAAQLVFGSVGAPAGEKTFIENPVKVYK